MDNLTPRHHRRSVAACAVTPVLPSLRARLTGGLRLREAWHRPRVLLLALAIALGPRIVGAQTVQPELPYAGGYLVTGNYAIGGVDVAGKDVVNGFATGNITISGVPENADILAAFLYWETITATASEAAGVRFRGADIDVNNTGLVRQASVPLVGQTASCWSSGGSTLTMTAFRADVLQLFPVQATTAKRIVNGTHTVRLPKRGTGNQTPESAGASLVVIYRNPADPLRKVVLYDGISVQTDHSTLVQRLQGFYGSRLGAQSARLSVIAGSGQKNPYDRLSFNGTMLPGEPFPDATTASQRGWANPTYDVSSLMPGSNGGDYGETAVASLNHIANGSYECLATDAVVFSAAVLDADGDGLPDALESATPGSPLRDPGGDQLPDLAAMGASPSTKDLFVEVNAMWAPAGTSYGTGADLSTDTIGHNHLPSPQVLKVIGDALKSGGVQAHFDVGSVAAYHGRGVVTHDADWVDDFTSSEADEYLVQVGARGGEQIRERACVPSATVQCPFPGYPGTVGWKLGFDALRYAPVGPNGEELADADLPAWLAAGAQRKRFDPSRIGLFHYVLYGHARGLPKSLLPCVDSSGTELPYADATAGACPAGATINPNLFKPSTSSGVSDLPGGSSLISLGLWDRFLGRPFIQASTTLHELGHNLELWHGGAGPGWGTATTPSVFEPNCKPNYLSVMNYLFQAKGLLDDTGSPHVDYSHDAYADLDEQFLADGSLGPLRYRTAWFEPLVPGTLAAAIGTTPAKRFCNGAAFPAGRTGPSTVRVDGGASSDPIDWDGLRTTASSSQDVNFDGLLSTSSRPLRGFDDWTGLRLTQAGAGFNAFGVADGILRHEGGGLFTTADGGILKYEGGGSLLQDSGILKYEGGGILRVEGGGILTIEDGGILRLEGGGILKYEGGGILKYEGGGILRNEGGGILRAEGGGILRLEGGGQELTYDAVTAVGRTPPNALQACVIGTSCDGSLTTPLHRDVVQWQSPNVGTAHSYTVYRSTGSTVASNLVTVGTTATTSLVDPEELPNGVQFTYLSTATFTDSVKSGASNTSTVTAVNDPPVAVNDAYTTGTKTFTVTAGAGVLANDADPDSARASLRAVLVTAPAKGTLTLNADGSFTYVPGHAASGQDSFTYVANDGKWSRDTSVPLSANSNVATVVITILKAGR